jgi:hypothetical protein
MRLATMLCCLPLLASLSVAAAVPASAAAGRPVAGGQCTLPVYRNHTPHPLLTARLNKNRTVTFTGTTCPWAFIAVFQVHGHHLRNNAEDLVCDALPGRNGHFSCSSLKRYPNGAQFGVMISGQFIVGVTGPGTPPTVIHRVPPSPRTGPSTGFGGLAHQVVRHHPSAGRRHPSARPHVRHSGAAKGKSWLIAVVLRALRHR